MPTTGLKTSASPKFGYSSSVAGVELYLAANSVDFELPDHYATELIIEIGKMVGINLRDKDVFSYTSGESQQQKQ